MILRAHDSDGVPIWVGEDGEAGAPEGVVRRLLMFMTLAGQVIEQSIHLISSVDLEDQD